MLLVVWCTPTSKCRVLPIKRVGLKVEGYGPNYLCTSPIVHPNSERSRSIPLSVEAFVYLSESLKLLRFRRLFRRVLLLSEQLPCIFFCSGILRHIHHKLFTNIVTDRLTKHIILDEAMVWFCTLGGGFSSLGDNCAGAAEVAGKISLMQLRLALEIGSPVIQAKAKLWFAQSLLQRGFLRTSARLLRLVYREWKPRMSKDTPADRRIDLMAVGLWERLRHSWRCRKRHAVVSLQNDVQYVDRRPKRRYRFPDLSALLNSL